jgi:hypothetical protein
MKNTMLHEIYINSIQTGIAIVLIIISVLLVNVIFLRKVENKKRKHLLRARSFYVACIVLIFIMARIWVEGFTHLLTVLGLVSAALVITNKETIMNFVGSLIINWRGLFSEDDLIQFQQYTGYVHSFGLLYFTLFEVSDSLSGQITGRMIRIPNGLICNTPLINYSQTQQLLERHFSLSISVNNDIELVIERLFHITKNTLTTFYQDRPEYTNFFLSKQNKTLSHRVSLDPDISINSNAHDKNTFEVVTRYYCFLQDFESIQKTIWIEVMKSIQLKQDIQLLSV